MLSCFKKRFLVQILLDILRPVAIRFLSQMMHGNCLFDELVNLKSVFWWVGTSAEHDHLFLISKTKQPNHRKIDPQLVTGTTCTTPFTYLSTLGHLKNVRFGVFRFKPWWFTRSLRTSFLRDLWLSESPLERGLVRKVQGFLTSGGLLGWCPWWLKKRFQ